MIKTDRKALLIGKNGHAQGKLIELSATEAGIIATRGAQPGTELELVFEIPAHQRFVTLKILSKVTYRHNTNHGTYLKLSFENISPENSDAIDDFLNYKKRLKEFGKKTKVQ
ncbi:MULTISPECIES: PilZ domain-containing protein [Thiomicrorhabdus]|uniref:PilZ domain-containing protein n=1 Tax=Thiomicrorhabdus heinhorstiae TaxID=2748010 RepID=A0ABS0BWX8_9GAMM|nr:MULTISPECIES: PilZ domain-containing protein [Thiomicrorhabdus]MBF6058312.1 PilZ domain-containing protein [Thiomicrorhabdus heinhorstiae]